ncbi:hypothetical protein [Geodermatophilus amargosae]|uniref:hypothetical protein n=1 Tax=Geodermatophilus amargosae TaxID=1296565 RepID=UPI0034DFA41A
MQTVHGHRSAATTLDLYGHLLTDQIDEVADAMDAARQAGPIRSHHAGHRRPSPAIAGHRRPSPSIAVLADRVTHPS